MLLSSVSSNIPRTEEGYIRKRELTRKKPLSPPPYAAAK